MVRVRKRSPVRRGWTGGVSEGWACVAGADEPAAVGVVLVAPQPAAMRTAANPTAAIAAHRRTWCCCSLMTSPRDPARRFRIRRIDGGRPGIEGTSGDPPTEPPNTCRAVGDIPDRPTDARDSELVAADVLVLQHVRGGGDQAQRALELVDVQVRDRH